MEENHERDYNVLSSDLKKKKRKPAPDSPDTLVRGLFKRMKLQTSDDALSPTSKATIPKTEGITVSAISKRNGRISIILPFPLHFTLIEINSSQRTTW